MKALFTANSVFTLYATRQLRDLPAAGCSVRSACWPLGRASTGATGWAAASATRPATDESIRTTFQAPPGDRNDRETSAPGDLQRNDRLALDHPRG